MKKIIVDILMFFLLLLEFSRVYLPSFIHETIGFLLIVLVVIHLIFNKNYLKKLFVGKYNVSRIIMLIINILFFISLILNLIFGILSSQDLFRFLNVGSLIIIKLHKIFAYISLLCLGLHLGINCSPLLKKICKKINNENIINVLIIIIACLGVYFFIDLDIFSHLIGKYGFSSFDGNILLNIFKYLIVVVSISLITDIIYKKIK